MAKTVASSGRRQDSGVAYPLWTFPGSGDELEGARLTATVLPSLLPCRVSGVALLDETDTSWTLVLQKDGEQLASTAAEQLLPELEPLFQEAFGTPSILIATAESETKDGRVPPSFGALGVQLLALAPLMTLRQRSGILLVGREALEPLSQEEELILLSLARSTIGIGNFRLYQSLEQKSQKLEDVLRRYRQLYHNTPVMMHSIDHEGKLTTVNDHWLRVLGYEESQVLGRRFIDFLTEESRRRALEVELPRFWKTGVAKDVEYQMMKRSGEVIDVLLSAAAEVDEEEKSDHTLAFIVDVSTRKRAERALRSSESKNRALLSAIPDMLFRVRADGTYLEFMSAPDV